MEEKQKNSERVRIISIVAAILMLTAFFGIYALVSKIIINSNIATMKELSAHDKMSVENTIRERENAVIGWAESVRYKGYTTIDGVISEIAAGRTGLGATKVYLADTKGNFYSSAGIIDSIDYYESFLQRPGRFIARFDTSEYGTSTEDKKELIVIGSEITEFTVDGVTFCYVLSENELSNFQNILKIDSYDGQGYSNIIDSDGYFIMSAETQHSSDVREKFFDRISDADLLKNALNGGGSVAVTSEVNGVSCIVVGSQVEGADWYFITVCPRTVFEALSRNITFIYLVMAIVMAAAFILVLVLIVKRQAADRKHKIELSKALELAQQANRSKTTFLNNMSHDIRTPMNAIIGFTTLAESHIDEPDVIKDHLEKISRSSKHLLSLINDVLDMSRIESGKVTISEDNESLIEILNSLKSIVQADIDAKQISFSMDTSGITNKYIFCDRLRLNQVLLNILSNAIKYTPQGGTVSMHVAEMPSHAIGKAFYEFRIKDSGIGMAPEFLSIIFEPFTRESTSTVSGIQGTGLGMAITKNIVDLMGGIIDVTSEPGKGSEFIVTIEFILSDDHKETEEKKEFRIEGKRILLVEDNELNQEIAVEILKGVGLDIETADNGQIACDTLLEKGAGYYDLILMDVQMPVMDGYEATRTIRAFEDKELANIPIIAMTANAFAEDKQNAEAAGMNGHVAKPINVPVLLETIKEII
ncbi:MAG: response regulator [Oscillospiraceae bacterium]|nr:response regulator [Oscillospiraceae bacterium]